MEQSLHIEHTPLKKVIKLARPQFLLASLVLFIMGAAWAIILGAEPGFWKLLWGYLIVFCAQLSVSFSNDYFDAESDRLWRSKPLCRGQRNPGEEPGVEGFSRRAAVTLILFSLFLGFSFTVYYAYPFWFFGLIIIGNLLGWFYAAPPIRLAYPGFGGNFHMHHRWSLPAGDGIPGCNRSFGWKWFGDHDSPAADRPGVHPIG